MKIEEIIKKNQNSTVLFLGRVTNFTAEELTNFLEAQGMTYADKYIGQEIAFVVLSSMLTPVEEDISNNLYTMKVPELRLVEFEKFYTKHIKPNTLMMSLKLSNDQERLKRLLKNSSFTDEVFLKLFKMYDWGGEGVYDNDENRDATITFVERFYRPNGFRDPAMVYSPITLSNIARDAKRADILDVMLTMPNHEIKLSRKEDMRPKNLREIIALNQNIASENIRYLLSFNDERINSFLACNSAITAKEQEYIYGKANVVTKIMLTQNSNLDDEIFKELLMEDEMSQKSLLTFQKMTAKRIKYILEVGLSDKVIALLGENILIEDVTESLIGINRFLDYNLASNQVLSQELLSNLYETYADEFMLPLSSNVNTSVELLREFYESDNIEVIKNLAANRSTDKKILKELCERNEHELNRALSLNPSVELFYLEQFALDTELIMLMSKNQTYLASINSAHVGMRSDDRY